MSPRWMQIRIDVQCFAAEFMVSSEQLSRVLKSLRHEQDRCMTMVSLWSRVVDRLGVYESYQVLNREEQRQVRLGRVAYGYPETSQLW